jgi:hypothetical protein
MIDSTTRLGQGGGLNFIFRDVDQLRLPDPYYSGAAGFVGSTLLSFLRSNPQVRGHSSTPDHTQISIRSPRPGSSARVGASLFQFKRRRGPPRLVGSCRSCCLASPPGRTGTGINISPSPQHVRPSDHLVPTSTVGSHVERTLAAKAADVVVGRKAHPTPAVAGRSGVWRRRSRVQRSREPSSPRSSARARQAVR